MIHKLQSLSAILFTLLLLIGGVCFSERGHAGSEENLDAGWFVELTSGDAEKLEINAGQMDSFNLELPKVNALVQEILNYSFSTKQPEEPNLRLWKDLRDQLSPATLEVLDILSKDPDDSEVSSEVCSDLCVDTISE